MPPWCFRSAEIAPLFDKPVAVREIIQQVHRNLVDPADVIQPSHNSSIRPKEKRAHELQEICKFFKKYAIVVVQRLMQCTVALHQFIDR
jgi:hypothetical protein